MRFFIFVFLIIFSFSASAGDAAADKRTLEREFDPVIVEGAKLPPLLGAPPKNIRLYAVENASFKPIPFQVDEKNDEGKYSLEFGTKKFEDEKKSFDKNDEIVFMAVDAGEKAFDIPPPPNARGNIEITLTDPVNGKSAWVYAFGFKTSPPELSKRDYVRFSPKKDCIYTPYYDVCNTPGKTYFNGMKGNAMSGGNGQDYFDRVKLRSHTKLRAFLFGLSFDITEEDFHAKILSFKDGPVRIIKRTQVYFSFVGGIKLKTDINENHYYYGYYTVPKTIAAPFDISSLSSYTDVNQRVDFNEKIIGNSYLNEYMSRPALVDGRMSEAEKKITGTKNADWNAVFGPRGNLIERTIIDPKVEVTYTHFYLDDITFADPPEEHKGVIGGFGKKYILTNVKKGQYWFKSVYIFPKHPFDSGQVKKYLDIEDNPILLEIKPYDIKRETE